jgi:xanthine dehydrogenase/oxidase
MSMYTQLRARPEGTALTEHEIEGNLAGNLCRCTGYRPILEGFRAFAGQPPEPQADADAEVDPLTRVKELPFPEALRTPAQPLTLAGAATWHRPITLAAMLELKRDLPEAKIICGNTEVGIEVMIKRLKFPHIIAGTHIPELCGTVETEAGVTLGSSTTLSDLEEVCKKQIAARPPHETQSFHAVLRQLHWFAGRQIRNVSSIAGNIVTGSPISDLNPLWSALNATFVCQSTARGARSVAATDFWTGYRQNVLAPDELLVSVFIPATKKYEYVKEFKQSHRRDDDIAIVNAGMQVAFEQDDAGKFVVKNLSCSYGGMAATTKLAEGVASAAPGMPWEDSSLQSLLKTLHEDMKLPPDVPGGMAEYRQALATSFFFKFFVYASVSLEADATKEYTSSLSECDRLAADVVEREPSRGLQYYGKGKDGEEVGLPLMHASANLQVSGEAQYNDDISDSADTLHAALVMSEKPHARISVDFSPAEEAPGVEGCYGANDVPGDNHIGAVVHDEEIFATDTVTCVGQIIGIVVADTKAHADDAARLVKVEYEELPPILSIEDAIEADSYFEYEGVTGHVLQCGDVEAGFSQCDHIVEGDVRCGGQEHFYLERECDNRLLLCVFWCNSRSLVIARSFRVRCHAFGEQRDSYCGFHAMRGQEPEAHRVCTRHSVQQSGCAFQTHRRRFWGQRDSGGIH